MISRNSNKFIKKKGNNDYYEDASQGQLPCPLSDVSRLSDLYLPSPYLLLQAQWEVLAAEL